MDYKRINYIVGGVVLLISAIVYLTTMQPTVSFWDCGEFIASAYTLSVPHPPGAPLWGIVGKVATMMPFGDNPAVKMNAVSAISSAFTVLFLYLVIVSVIKNWRGFPKNNWDAVIVFGSAAIGALSYAFCDSFWFNALEAEVYALGTMLVGLGMWLLMYWWEKADEKGNEKILMLLGYVVGLSMGIHLLVVQLILVAGFIYYFRKFEYNRKSFFIAFIITCLSFVAVYPIIVIWFPTWLSGDIRTLKIDNSSVVTFLAAIIVPALIYGVYWGIKNQKRAWAFAFGAIFLVFIGYSIYTGVLLRAKVDNLPINENEPKDLTTLVSYLSREQYGDAPFWPRRYSQEPMHRRTWTNYSSDMDFMWNWQINHMFNRYLGWQYIGRASYNQDAGIDWSKLYGIPFLIGLFGLFYHFRKDWKLGVTFLWAFLLMGVFTALFQRQQDPQPRERDYFYEGAFFVYSLWIGIGVMGILELIRDGIKNAAAVKGASIAFLLFAFIFIPGNMYKTNHFYNDRSNNYVPFDYAYNILQSVAKDGIVFTNGDNDTFPLWYLQSVGYRQDVRIVNLSLLNTDWYIKEMKNSSPYGALKVPISLSDAQIEKMAQGPSAWNDFKVVSVGVPPEAYPDSLRSKGETPDKLVWKMPATINAGNNQKGIKVSDMMIFEIIKTNNWQRPIYFSATVSDDNYQGLDEYLVGEGMAKRLVPFKGEAGRQFRVNNLMYENFTTLRQEPSKTPATGFMFRGYNDPDIFFEQVTINNVQNYRSQYLTMAYSYYESDPQKVNNLLDKMEEIFPRKIIPIDYRIQHDIAMMYYRVGNNAKFNEYSADVEKTALEELRKNPNDMTSAWNPYKLLIDIYDARNDYKSELELLERIDRIAPGSPEVKMKIETLKQKLQGQ
ncbi:MAG: DUF2723 domain-containing protein [Ignavibacteriae bacterium]|nr:MAG: DUF2723 domain-containing protein [Ignavibacteriota bacterium]